MLHILLQDFREELLKQEEPEAKQIALAIELFTDGSLNTFAKNTNGLAPSPYSEFISIALIWLLLVAEISISSPPRASTNFVLNTVMPHGVRKINVLRTLTTESLAVFIFSFWINDYNVCIWITKSNRYNFIFSSKGFSRTTCVLTMVLIADTKEELDTDTESLLATGRKHLCQLSILKYQQKDFDL